MGKELIVQKSILINAGIFRYQLKKDNDKTLFYLTEDKSKSDYKRYEDAENLDSCYKKNEGIAGKIKGCFNN